MDQITLIGALLLVSPAYFGWRAYRYEIRRQEQNSLRLNLISPVLLSIGGSAFVWGVMICFSQFGRVSLISQLLTILVISLIITSGLILLWNWSVFRLKWGFTPLVHPDNNHQDLDYSASNAVLICGALMFIAASIGGGLGVFEPVFGDRGNLLISMLSGIFSIVLLVKGKKMEISVANVRHSDADSQSDDEMID